MTVTRFAVGLLLISSVNAFFRLPCAKPVLNARVDPIVNPGKASGHAHTIMGSEAIGFSTTFEDLRNSDCSTCKVKDDHSAYWIPELFYQYKNGSFQGVNHGGMLVYYIQRNAANETVQAFPDGLRMLAGNPFLRSNTNTPEAKAITWNCINFNGPGEPQTSGFANTHCPNGLRAQVFFPACWDGKNLDSADHKSHMAYPDGIDNGLCPPSHPNHLVSIFYEVYFDVAPFNALNDGGRFVLSNGDPTGYGLHGDFFNGWDRSVLSRAVATCTASSGVIEDCPVFQNEGRFNADSVMNSCAAKNPMPDELVGPGNLLSHLPGCVAVTEGPAPATAANVVPGCVAGSGSGSGSTSGTGSGNPAPSSPAPGSASSSSTATSPSTAPPHVNVASTSSSTTSKQSPVPASPSQASHSSSSTPAMNAQPTTTTTTTQTKPAPSPTLPNTSSGVDVATASSSTPSKQSPAPASPSQASHSSSSTPAMNAQPTTTTTATTQTKPAPSPTLPSTSGGSSAAVPYESHVPSPSPSSSPTSHHKAKGKGKSHQHKPANHGHGHGHQEEEDYCGAPQSKHHGSVTFPHVTRRRHHMKHGHRSPAHV